MTGNGLNPLWRGLERAMLNIAVGAYVASAKALFFL
jgi:hypothetical protein